MTRARQLISRSASFPYSLSAQREPSAARGTSVGCMALFAGHPLFIGKIVEIEFLDFIHRFCGYADS